MKETENLNICEDSNIYIFPPNTLMIHSVVTRHTAVNDSSSGHSAHPYQPHIPFPAANFLPFASNPFQVDWYLSLNFITSTPTLKKSKQNSPRKASIFITTNKQNKIKIFELTGRFKCRKYCPQSIAACPEKNRNSKENEEHCFDENKWNWWITIELIEEHIEVTSENTQRCEYKIR